ncbi:translocation/assembly module TamB domain-containing protein [Ideonella sp. BN130291]|uniref:translocation/assembly module TamB domain-containing protein n=1 Tax=Ideonella sp. BN130291 TaxID=3112940 RepID=UPI002E27693E|nr:translocation/assembly module TamB domain-containing protein [Ideonella sp. BN130291]
MKRANGGCTPAWALPSDTMADPVNPPNPAAGAPTPTPTPARRSRLRRWSLATGLLFIGLLLLLGLALVGGWQALRTEAGTAWLLSQVSGLRITGGRGSLQGGPFAADHVAFKLDGSAVQVDIDAMAWQDLQWQWRPYSGAWLRLVVTGLRAQRVAVRTGPASDTPLQAPRSLQLPIELLLPQVQVQALQIDSATPLRELRTSLHFGADQGRVHRVEQLAFAWDRLQLQGQGHIDAVAPMALAAQLQVQSQALAGATGPLGSAWQAGVTAGGTLQRLTLGGQLRAAPGPQAPAATLDLHSVLTPFAAWPLAELQAHMAGLDLATLATGLPATRLDGHATLATTGMAQPARVDLQVHNRLPGRWDEGQLPVRSLQLDLRGQPRDHQRLDVHAMALALGTTAQPAGDIRGSGRWNAGTLALDTTLSAVQPARLDQRLAAMTLSGPVTMTLHGGDTATARRWAADLRARLEGQLAGGSGAPVRLQAEGSATGLADGLEITLRQLNASAGTARATAQATAREQQGRWRFKGSGELAEFDPLPWWPGPEGSAWRQGGHRLNGRWEADLAQPAGTAQPNWQALRGRMQLTLANSRLAGVPLQGQASLRADAGTPQAALVADLQAADSRLQVEAQLALQGDGAADAWRVNAQAPALAALAPLVRLVPGAANWEPRSGSVTLQAQAQGRWPALRSEGDARIAKLKAGNVSLDTADARWRFGGGATAPLEVALNADGLAWGAQRAERLRLQASGTQQNHQLQLRLDTAARPPAWTDALLGSSAGQPTGLQLQLTGAWLPQAEGGRWQGQVQQLHAGPIAGGPGAAWLVADGLQAELAFGGQGQLLQANARPGQLQLLGATLRWRDMRWQAGSGDKPAQVNVQAQLDPLRVAPLLARLQPEFGWGGDLTVGGHVAITTGAAFQADVVLERSRGDLSVTDEGGTQTLGLTDLRFGVNANEGVWHFTEALAGSTVGVLAGAQSLRLPPRAVWPDKDSPMEGVLELRVDNLGVWGPWTPPGWRLTGQLHTGASLGGRFGAPEYTGRLEGRGVGARNLLQGVNVTDGDILIALKGPTAQIERFTVKGGDGLLRLEGGASLGDTPRAQLRLNAGHFELLGRVDRRIVASGQAELALERDAIRLDGRFVVDEGLIDFSRSDAPTLDDDVSVVQRPSTKPIDSARAQAQEAQAPPKPPRSVQATMNIDLGERLHIRGRGLDAYLRGQLRMTTPNGRLAVNGTVRTENGTYAAYGQKLEIERGLVDFSGPVENPRLDIVALRPNTDVRVGVSVGGTALKPRVRLFSEPEMAEADKLSWLVLGRAPEGLGRADTALLQHAALALLSGEGESTTDKVIKALGLDDFSVRQEGEGDLRNTVVSLGKQISRRWYVGYERGVNSTAGSWQAIYRIAQRFTLRAQAGEDNALDLIWTWRWN